MPTPPNCAASTGSAICGGGAGEWFEKDNPYFLHQNLSTPVLQVVSRAYGLYLEDLNGKTYIDMHGNGVHNAGFNNPDIIQAVRRPPWPRSSSSNSTRLTANVRVRMSVAPGPAQGSRSKRDWMHRLARSKRLDVCRDGFLPVSGRKKEGWGLGTKDGIIT